MDKIISKDIQQNFQNDQQQDQQSYKGAILTEQLKDEMENKLKDLNLEPKQESNIYYDILGTLKMQCRYFNSKKEDGNDMAFAFLKNQEKTCGVQLIIEKNKILNQQYKENFKHLLSMFRENTVIQVKGNIGTGKTGGLSLYVQDFHIYQVQPNNLTCLKLLQLYSNKIIDYDYACTALQISQEEFNYLLKIGKDQIEQPLGTGFKGSSSKAQNKLKMRLVEISRLLENKPMTKINNDRPPRYPKELYQNLDYYQPKYSKIFEAKYIDNRQNLIQNQNINIDCQSQKNQNIDFVENQQQTDNMLYNNGSDQIQAKKNSNENVEFQQKSYDLQKEINEKLIQNLPNQEDKDRIQYFNQKKAPQVEWFIQQIQKLQQRQNKKIRHFIDIGGGRGDLSLSIAQIFQDSKVTVIDINEPSLEQGRQLALKYSIKNIEFVHKGVEKLNQNQEDPYDMVIGLHCCGGLSDAVLSFAALNQLPFFLCTCCFSSNFDLVPKQFDKIINSFYRKLEDRQTLCRFSESHGGYEMAEKCMNIVNNIRMLTVKKILEGQNNAKINEKQDSDFNQKISNQNYNQVDKQKQNLLVQQQESDEQNQVIQSESQFKQSQQQKQSLQDKSSMNYLQNRPVLEILRFPKEFSPKNFVLQCFYI